MNAQYKSKADVKRRYKDFQVGDEVIVHLWKEHFPVGTYSKLKMKKFVMCKIVKRNDSENTYEVELHVVLNISPVFNIFNLKIFYEVILLVCLTMEPLHRDASYFPPYHEEVFS